MVGLDFQNLIRQLNDAPVCTRDALSIWGGEFNSTELAPFLDAWDLGQRNMPWQIWEWVSKIEIRRQATMKNSILPEDSELLERGRLFGPGGDLSLRRDGGRFLWHFVGPPQNGLPTGFEWVREGRQAEGEGGRFEIANYWQGRLAGWELQLHAQQVLLWGQENRDPELGPQGTWHDARVGRAPRLDYPGLSGRDPQGRVKLCYREYLYADNVEAVWWLGLKGLNEPCEEVTCD